MSTTSALVADVGTRMARLGVCGDDFPRYFAEAVVAELESAEDPTGESQPQSRRFRCDPSPQEAAPAEIRGGADTPDTLEAVLSHGAAIRLGMSMKERPFLAVEKVDVKAETREKLAEMCFEKLGVPALFFAKDAVLGAYATARATALVVDCGASSTRVVPVIDGWAEQGVMMTSPIGGDLLDAEFAKHLAAKHPLQRLRPGYAVKRSYEANGDVAVQEVDAEVLRSVPDSYRHFSVMSGVREAKETLCLCADTIVQPGDSRFENLSSVPYELPDMTVVDVGIQKFQVPELYFDTSSVLPTKANVAGDHMSHEALPHLVAQVARRCHRDTAQTLLASTVVVGGSACFEGFTERLRLESESVLHATHPSWKVKLLSPELRERQVAAWLGGSILASLPTLEQMWVSKADYDEHGSSIVNKRCP